MYIISPLSNCASQEASDRFLGFIKDISKITYETETETISYAWFRAADGNDDIPRHFVRGFEVYKNIAASQITHRSSKEYKTFRTAVAAEKLLDRASDLRFWQPTGYGFMTRKPEMMRSASEAQEFGHVIVDEINPKAGKKSALLKLLGALAELAENGGEGIRSWWVLEYREEYEDDTVMVFQRYDSKAEAIEFSERQDTADNQKRIGELADWRRITRWLESGIGFLGR